MRLDQITKLPLWAHAAAAIGAVALFQTAKTALDASYAASRHPVDYATGQTTFSGEAIKGYYATMIEAGTLDIYRTTQIIDFGFIAGIACIGLFLLTLIARMGRTGSIARRVGLSAALAALAGATCDAIENGWSFIMLANPTGFADWLALPYSAFAVAKFALLTLAMALTLGSLLCTAAGRITRRPRLG